MRVRPGSGSSRGYCCTNKASPKLVVEHARPERPDCSRMATGSAGSEHVSSSHRQPGYTPLPGRRGRAAALGPAPGSDRSADLPGRHRLPRRDFVRLGKDPAPVPEPFAEMLRLRLAYLPNMQTMNSSGDRWLFPGGLAGWRLSSNAAAGCPEPDRCSPGGDRGMALPADSRCPRRNQMRPAATCRRHYASQGVAMALNAGGPISSGPHADHYPKEATNILGSASLVSTSGLKEEEATGLVAVNASKKPSAIPSSFASNTQKSG